MSHNSPSRSVDPLTEELEDESEESQESEEPLGGGGPGQGVQEFRAEVRHRPGALVVSVRGDLDLFTVPPFLKRAAQALDRLGEERRRGRPAPVLVADLTRVPSLDSAGLVGLVTVNRLAHAEHGNDTVPPAGDPRVFAVYCRRGGQPWRAMQAAGVDRHLPVFPDHSGEGWVLR